MVEESVDAIVIGAGISGLATIKCLREAGVRNVIALERSDAIGGLWTYRESDAYGVMEFTHINVSKANYSFSDFPFPEEVPDYPHHSQMCQYIQDYARHFNLVESIRFNEEVTSLRMDPETKRFVIRTTNRKNKSESLYSADNVAVASGHHVSAFKPSFDGLDDTFKGTVIHSSEYKNATINGVDGNVLIVGIGNSAVDVAVNAASAPSVKKVFLSTRSGAWVICNYVLGVPTDLYACRFFLNLPWWIGTYILEWIMILIFGHPNRWKLNPKMRALQTQPTVSPTLVHHIQRQHIEVVPNISRFSGPRNVILENDRELQVDHAIFCTGFNIGFPFIDKSLHDQIVDNSTNEISLYKNVFSSAIGHRLAFIGYIQPSSGGVLPVSEIQARWFGELIHGRVRLPKRNLMEQSIQEDAETVRRRYHKSPRHTIQRDPLLYNDEIASFIGAKPSLWRHPRLAWRLLFGSCGTAQWRLQGPNSWHLAKETVLKVPVAPLMHVTGLLLVFLVGLFLIYVTKRFLA